MDDLLLEPHSSQGDPSAPPDATTQNLHDFLESAAERRVGRVLSETGGKRVEAARRLGIDRTTLYRSIRKYKIEHAE